MVTILHGVSTLYIMTLFTTVMMSLDMKNTTKATMNIFDYVWLCLTMFDN